MSIIQRRADSDAKGGKYVVVVDRSKQFYSNNYGASFTERNTRFTYIVESAAISEDTGDVFVATRGSSTKTLLFSRDGLATTNPILPNTIFENILVIDVAMKGEKLYVLGDGYIRIIDVKAGTFTGEWLNSSTEARKLAVSSNGKYLVYAGKPIMYGSYDYGSLFSMMKQLASPQATKNEFKDMVMSGNGKYIFYSYVSGSLDYNGIFRIHGLDDWNTVDRISVAEINNYYIPIKMHVSHTGKHIILEYESSTQGYWISHDFGRSFTRLPDAYKYAMSSNGEYIYYISGVSLYRSIDYGKTFAVALSGINSSYKLAISK